MCLGKIAMSLAIWFGKHLASPRNCQVPILKKPVYARQQASQAAHAPGPLGDHGSLQMTGSLSPYVLMAQVGNTELWTLTPALPFLGFMKGTIQRSKCRRPFLLHLQPHHTITGQWSLEGCLISMAPGTTMRKNVSL